ncbi:MAG TPA: hypothetical protein DE060_08665 [Lentisphaeria bacterium]|nr:hypothetical protein [Lentisphaeria bacterium]HCG49259.1 hypothetical protein [Lentisphaeria bacterium]
MSKKHQNRAKDRKNELLRDGSSFSAYSLRRSHKFPGKDRKNGKTGKFSLVTVSGDGRFSFF